MKVQSVNVCSNKNLQSGPSKLLTVRKAQLTLKTRTQVLESLPRSLGRHGSSHQTGNMNAAGRFPELDCLGQTATA